MTCHMRLLVQLDRPLPHQRVFSLSRHVIRSSWRLSHHSAITKWIWVPATCHRSSTACIIVMPSVEHETHSHYGGRDALPEEWEGIVCGVLPPQDLPH